MKSTKLGKLAKGIFLLILLLTTYLSFDWIKISNKYPPKVSLITSVWKGDLFIKGFLEDIVKLTIFDQCELILINPNSPGNEEIVIKEYLKKYSNIRYVKLDHDPGIYGVWNIGVKMATADLVSNANIDDRHNPEFLAMQVKALEEDLSIDLVYGDFYYSKVANSTFDEKGRLHYSNEFSPKAKSCSQGPHPLWRKSMHDRCGFFDETFLVLGDWEMWCRAVSYGSKFKKIPGISGVYYINHQGLSFSKKKKAIRRKEQKIIKERYQHLWE